MIVDSLNNLTEKYNKSYPGCWQTLSEFRQIRGKEIPDWPDWCYCPMAAAIAVITRGGDPSMELVQEFPPAELAALAAWKISKGVYRFAPELMAELIKMPIEGEIPSEVLCHLPEWGVCIETPGLSFLGNPIDGILAHLEYDVNQHYAELRMLALKVRGGTSPIILHLGELTISESVEILIQESGEQAKAYQESYMFDVGELKSQYSADVVPLLNLVLYLCSDDPEYRESRKPYKPTDNIISQTHTGYFETKAPKFWHLGDKTGKALREAQQTEGETTVTQESGTRASPRLHYRRAHWHHFWAGSRDGERKLVLHWLPPTLVGQE